MKKLLILSLLTITLINVGCNKKSSSSSNETSSSSSEKKCINECNAGTHPNESFPDEMVTCNLCGMAFYK
jgi:hypothetical protein